MTPRPSLPADINHDPSSCTRNLDPADPSACQLGALQSVQTQADCRAGDWYTQYAAQGRRNGSSRVITHPLYPPADQGFLHSLTKVNLLSLLGFGGASQRQTYSVLTAVPLVRLSQDTTCKPEMQCAIGNAGTWGIMPVCCC